MTTLFITGIDTNIGKTIACGALANTLLKKQFRTFTQKWVETGVSNIGAKISADLAEHQCIANSNFNTAKNSEHAPYLFQLPASPHLAAKMEKTEIDCAYLIRQTQKLEEKCQHLLIEGAGGLCVPLNSSTLTIDLAATLNLPIVLVTSGKLGSINHTILSLDYCTQRNLDLRAVVYNAYPNSSDVITKDTRMLLKHRVAHLHPKTIWLDMEIGATDLALDDIQTARLLR
jgi:dethiobiotin synthetase